MMAQKNETAKTVKLTIYLHAETRKALKIRALEVGLSVTKVVEHLIASYLDRTGPSGRQIRAEAKMIHGIGGHSAASPTTRLKGPPPHGLACQCIPCRAGRGK